MSELTPRVGLYKPADDGSQPINVATDLNDNLEKLDSAIGFVPATSATPPTTPFNGMATYETDTGRAKFYKNSVWTYLLAAGANFLSHINLGKGFRLGLGVTGTPSAVIDVEADSVTSTPLVKYKATAEANPRMQLDSDGIKLGGGATTADTRIYRPAPNQLSVTGGVNLENSLSVSGVSALSDVDVSGSLSVGGSIDSDLFVAGDIDSSGLNWTRYLRKLVDTPRLNTIALQDDPEIVVALEANTTYFIEAYLLYTSNATADFRVAWSTPAGSTGLRWCLGEAIAGTDREATTMRTGVHAFTTEIIYGGQVATFFIGALEVINITTSSTAGNLRLRAAQGTANNTDAATLRAGTVLKVTKIA